jgi:hypothetical protein
MKLQLRSMKKIIKKYEKDMLFYLFTLTHIRKTVMT